MDTKNDNTVELIGVYGSDESHALSAWTGVSTYLSGYGLTGDVKLIHARFSQLTN